ncbi:hypothetical protein DXG01_005803 [Tephrocybe rancida]|nr:hypothetical protein DXG01_005803 [Tephrocybe rancida]
MRGSSNCWLADPLLIQDFSVWCPPPVLFKVGQDLFSILKSTVLLRASPMEDVPRVPRELVLKIVEMHINDSSTLSACSLASAFLRVPCQKRIFASITLNLVAQDEDRNDSLVEIVSINPVIYTYVRTLNVTIGHHGGIPAAVMILPYLAIRSISLTATIKPSETILRVLQRILQYPSLQSVTFPKHALNMFPLRILQACSQVCRVSMAISHPFRQESDTSQNMDVSYDAKSSPKELICTNRHVFLQVLTFFNLEGLEKLNAGATLCDETNLPFLQGVIDKASLLTRLSIHIAPSDVSKKCLSLANASNLKQFIVHLHCQLASGLNSICDMIESHCGNLLRIISVLLPPKTPVFDNAAECSVWERLDRLATRPQYSTRLRIVNFLVPGTDDSAAPKLADSFSVHLPALVAVNKVHFTDPVQHRSWRVDGASWYGKLTESSKVD